VTQGPAGNLTPAKGDATDPAVYRELGHPLMLTEGDGDESTGRSPDGARPTCRWGPASAIAAPSDIGQAHAERCAAAVAGPDVKPGDRVATRHLGQPPSSPKDPGVPQMPS
jgi:hypothetical protein